MKADLTKLVISALLMSESLAKEPWAKNTTPEVREFHETGEYNSCLWIILLALTVIMFLVVFLLVVCHEPKREGDDEKEDMEKGMDEAAMMDMMMSAP